MVIFNCGSSETSGQVGTVAEPAALFLVLLTLKCRKASQWDACMHVQEYWHCLVSLIFFFFNRQSGFSAQLRNINLPRCITKTKSWTKQPEETLKLSDSTGVTERHTKLQHLIRQQAPLDCSCPITFLTYAWNYEIQCSSTTLVRFSFGAWLLVTAEKTEVCFAKASKMKFACCCCTKLPSSMH